MMNEFPRVLAPGWSFPGSLGEGWPDGRLCDRVAVVPSSGRWPRLWFRKWHPLADRSGLPRPSRWRQAAQALTNALFELGAMRPEGTHTRGVASSAQATGGHQGQ